MPRKSLKPNHKRYADRPEDSICSFILADGTRCGAYRAKKSAHPHLCAFHQGRINGTACLVRPWEMLPMIYKKYVGPTIRELLVTQLEKPRTEQLELYEELALLRAMATDVVRAWSQLAEAGHHDKALAMAELMKDNVEAISKVVNTISTIEARQNDEINAHTLNGLVAQITSMFYSVCGKENAELAYVLEQRIKNELVIPAIEAKGTTLTPDQVVEEMDDSIPMLN